MVRELYCTCTHVYINYSRHCMPYNIMYMLYMGKCWNMHLLASIHTHTCIKFGLRLFSICCCNLLNKYKTSLPSPYTYAHTHTHTQSYDLFVSGTFSNHNTMSLLYKYTQYVYARTSMIFFLPAKIYVPPHMQPWPWREIHLCYSY